MTHNLDINTYSLEEMFCLFDLTYDLTEESMRAAKKKVLMIHPDKSKLSSEYFLFYKQAYEIILDIYKQKNRIQNAPLTSTVYNPEVTKIKGIGNSHDSINGTNPNFNPQNLFASETQNESKELKGNKFNNKFNELYETNMTKKTDLSKHDWFTQESTQHNFAGRGINSKNMSEALEEVKHNQNLNQQLSMYSGVREIRKIGFGTNYYDQDDGDENSYVECDIFSKLKFDDLRKVHRDQTVFAVSEKDFSNVPQYKSIDQYINAREQNKGIAMSKEHSTAVLEKQQREYEQLMMHKQQRDLLLQKEYEAKQKNVQAAFMKISNGNS
jgi:hypothetical protein